MASWCGECGEPYLTEQGHRCAKLPAVSGRAVERRRPREEEKADINPRDLVKEIAMDIGKSTVAYVEVMYPKAIEAASSTFKLSLRNHIYNEIMAAIEVTDEGKIVARLKDRKQFRRWWVGQYRKIRRKGAA